MYELVNVPFPLFAMWVELIIFSLAGLVAYPKYVSNMDSNTIFCIKLSAK